MERFLGVGNWRDFNPLAIAITQVQNHINKSHMSQFKKCQGTTAIGINVKRHFLKGSYSSGKNTRLAVQETSQAPECSQRTTAIGINVRRHFLKGNYSSGKNTR